MTETLLQGVGLGFGAGTSFGALHNLLLSMTIQRGWRYGLLIVITPLLTDAPIILLMLFVLDRLPESAQRIIPIAGGLFLLWLAWGAWQQFRHPPSLHAEEATTRNLSFSTLIKGMAVNLLNPAPYIYWGAVGGALLREGFAMSVAHGIGFLFAFYVTFLGIMAAFVLLFDRLRHVDLRVTRALSLISVVIMTLLGLQFIWQGLQG
jgi:threonine/homoserine/homoserine lactone efflux protein